MKQIKKFCIVLCVIDVFSNYAGVFLKRDKKGETISKVFKKKNHKKMKS